MTNERRKAELKAKIEAAATAVFLRKGYAEAKIIDIANEAQISPSTIYLYFDGKKQLFASLNIPEVAQLRPEYDRRREEITRGALTLVGERGFEGTTMDDIAEEMGFSSMPVCMAKTQYSLSDDPELLGRPRGFTMNVREMYVSAGAGFVVVLTGAVMTMPGLPKEPAALRIDVNRDGVITGLF